MTIDISKPIPFPRPRNPDDELRARLGDIQDKAGTLGLLHGLNGNPAWEAFRSRLQGQYDTQLRALLRESSDANIHRLQGSLQVLAWIIRQPKEIEVELNKLGEEISVIKRKLNIG